MERSFTRTEHTFLPEFVSRLIAHVVSVLSNVDDRTRLWIALVIAAVAVLFNAGESYAAIGRW